MYTVEFYETTDGKSELWDFLEELRVKTATSKDARIQYKQISLYIQLLQDNGVFYFFFENDTFVLLHHFRKKSQKALRREIEKAKNERIDYITRKENNKL